MGFSLKQSSLSGGVISASALGRTDQQHYASGLRTCSNAWITRYGTVENRPGTFYDETVPDAERVRLIRFGASVAQGILLVFTNYRLRFIENGEWLHRLASPAAWDADTSYGISYVVDYLGNEYYSTTSSNVGNVPSLSPSDWGPMAPWSMATSYDVGAVVNYAGGKWQSLSTGNINHQPNTSPTYWMSRDDGAILEIPTPIPESALPTFQVVQINDLMFIVDHGFYPQTLMHFADDDWTMTNFQQNVGIDPPTGVTVSPGFPTGLLGQPQNVMAAGVAVPFSGYVYTVSAYDNSPARISDTSDFANQFPSDIHFDTTPGTPTTISWSPVSGAEGYAIFRGFSNDSASECGIIGITDGTSFTDSLESNDTHGATAIRVANPSVGGSTQFQYQVTAVDAVTGIESIASSTATANGSTPTSGNPNVISWGAVTGAGSYNIYKAVNGVFGFIGSSSGTSFNDINYIPDTSRQPPVNVTLFATTDDYPAVVGTYQQRLLFANTINEPQSVWGSAVGVFTAFTTTIPVLDSGAFKFTIFGQIRQFVHSLVDLGKLVIHTNNGEYVCNGNQAGTLTPSSPTLVRTGSAGGALIVPVVVGNTDLFVQEGATRLLDLRYEVQSFSYAGKDLTKYASDVFLGRTIVSMDWQKLPHSIVWCVLDNGQMVGLTYVREDELWAWHVHASSNGVIENVCVITEGNQDIVYLCVRREIDGDTVRYIENLGSRDCLDTVLYSDSYFADSAQIYDGRNTGSTTMTLTGTGWTQTDLLTLTASSATFSAGNVGDEIILQLIDDVTGLVTDQVTLRIMTYTSPTVVSVYPESTVPAWAQATALTTWGLAVSTFTGIDHLEGESLSILADGNVAADPLDPLYPEIVVAGGSFTLPSPAMVVLAGLPIQMDVETLPLENATGETIANKRIQIREVCPIFYHSRGGSFGQDFEHLNEWVQPTTALPGFPVSPYTGPARVPIRGTSEISGQVAIRLTNPVPFSFSAMILTGEIGS